MASREYQLILNMTEGTFFEYYGEGQYERILKMLFETNAFGTSRWFHTDKIIFVPEHLRQYVSKKYERVFP
jgi:hypothetical protein